MDIVKIWIIEMEDYNNCIEEVYDRRPPDFIISKEDYLNIRGNDYAVYQRKTWFSSHAILPFLKKIQEAAINYYLYQEVIKG
jgi:hypothetical protein